MARLPRRCDPLGVIAIGEHLAAAPPPAVSQRSVDVPRRGDLKSLHPSAERRLVIGFHQHMHVVALQADMNDPEPLAKRRGGGRTASRPLHFSPRPSPSLSSAPTSIGTWSRCKRTGTTRNRSRSAAVIDASRTALYISRRR